MPGLLAICVLAVCCSEIDELAGGDDDGTSDGGTGSLPQPLVQVENDLLAEINKERTAAGLPALVRDPGLDAVERYYGYDMLRFKRLNNHIDRNGRDSEARARFFGTDPTVRCSEIIQWWGGAPSGRVHYEGYFNSPSHHMAYMEMGALNLGPTKHAGVVVLAGSGPIGTQFEGRAGSYSGVMLCDKPITLARDPAQEP